MMYKAVFCMICVHLTDALTATENEQRTCTEYLEGGNNGSISSPGFPDNYPNNVNYTRIINVKNTRSRVDFTVLYLEAETDGNLSCFDYLKIERLDVVPCCYTLFKGCRNQTNSIIAEGMQFRVSFISDSSSTRKGFLLHWKANASVESERRYYTENLTSSSGQLTSPEYPCNYPNNVNYAWIIQTGNDYVNFTIPELDAEVRTHGAWFCVDYLKIEKMDPCCITVTEGCRAQMYAIVVKGGQFRVSFISEYSRSGRGFRLNWQGANVIPTGLTILSLNGLLFIILSGVIGVLLVVITSTVIYFKKNIKRSSPQLMSDSAVDENVEIYENLTAYQRHPERGPKSTSPQKTTKMELYTELQF